MLLDPRGDVVEVVDQAEHARHAGAMAELLDPELVPPPRAPFVTATAHHDDGWIPYDREPGLDPERGLPYSFRNIPLGPYVGIWRRGFDLAFRRGAHVGLLVSLHGLQFFLDEEDPRARALVEHVRGRQAQALGDLDVGGSPRHPGEPLASQSAWLRFLDGVSLVSLGQWSTPWTGEVRGTTYELEQRRGGGFVMDPWPFREPEVDHGLEVRLLDPGPYADEAELHAALGDAERGRRVVHLEAPG